MALTVSQIAELIKRPDADKAAVIERLRSWTADRLIEPVGDPNPGTGRRRLYDDATVYDAAILNTLADLGLPVGGQRFSMVTLIAERAKQLWAKRHDSPKPLFLEIADFEPDDLGRDSAFFLHEGDKKGHHGKLIHPRADTALVINLTHVFGRIEERRAELFPSVLVVTRQADKKKR
jgi:hypothetical protein